MNNRCYYCGKELGTGDFQSPLTIPACQECNRAQLVSRDTSLILEISKPYTVEVNDGTRQVKVNLKKLIDFLIENNLTEE
jgi:hypothetical protein